MKTPMVKNIFCFFIIILCISCMYISFEKKTEGIDKRIDSIITMGLSNYVDCTNANNIKISMMFRELSDLIISSETTNIDEFKTLQGVFFENLKTNFISNKYPISVDECDIFVGSTYISNIMNFTRTSYPERTNDIQYITARFFDMFINKLNEYEYSKENHTVD